MDVSGQFHALADLTPAKESSVSIAYETWWAPESVWALWRREKICTNGNQTQVVQAVRKDTAIQTEKKTMNEYSIELKAPSCTSVNLRRR
jgi:hypothetical protein